MVLIDGGRVQLSVVLIDGGRDQLLVVWIYGGRDQLLLVWLVGIGDVQVLKVQQAGGDCCWSCLQVQKVGNGGWSYLLVLAAGDIGILCYQQGQDSLRWLDLEVVSENDSQVV